MIFVGIINIYVHDEVKHQREIALKEDLPNNEMDI